MYPHMLSRVFYLFPSRGIVLLCKVLCYLILGFFWWKESPKFNLRERYILAYVLKSVLSIAAGKQGNKSGSPLVVVPPAWSHGACRQ